jgi:alkane 1-monooxygenase
MHLILPLMFTLLPAVSQVWDIPGLTLAFSVIVLPLMEWLLKEMDTGPGAGMGLTDFKWGFWFPRAAMMLVIAQGLWFTFHASSMDWSGLIWLALSCGYVAGAIGIVLAHELGHRRAWADRALARALLLMVGYGHYALEHNRGHHRAAATYPDPATAREHESLWEFLPRYYSGVFTDSVKLARASPGLINEALALLAVSLILFTSVFVYAGWKGLAFCLLQAATAQLLVGTVDYMEHWGLQRKIEAGRPERMGAQHTWDCANWVADAMLFNLPRHASHHMEPSLNSDQLYRSAASPQMPTGYAGMVLLAFIPPLYKKIMTPRLKSHSPTHY